VRDAADPARSAASSDAAAIADAVTVTDGNPDAVTVIHLVLALAMQHWLVVNDIHLDPFSKAGVVYGSDTTATLWRSAVRAMHADVPDARVVLLGGDMLAHHFAAKAVAAHASPQASALATVRTIADSLGAAFPRAQFLVALGNNDDPCGDYRSDTGGPYLLQLARVWQPLVNRGGAAPTFVAQFSRGGYYTARLPLRAARAIVLNSVFWSFLYSGGCYSRPRNPGAMQLAWLQRQLERLPPGEAAIGLMHMPPGFDPQSTALVHRVVAVPFLRSSSNRALLRIVGSHAKALRFIVAAHTHRYDFRIPADVPMIIASSISPVYLNNPAFFVLDVDADGVLHDVHPYVYDPDTLGWIAKPSFAAMYGVHEITASSLGAIAAKIRSDASVRSAWSAAFDAWSRSDGGFGDAWLPYACAQTELGAGYAACAGTARRTRILVVIALGALLCFIVAASLLLRRSATQNR
jgi:Calcineurin-like phosphoesterase